MIFSTTLFMLLGVARSFDTVDNVVGTTTEADSYNPNSSRLPSSYDSGGQRLYPRARGPPRRSGNKRIGKPRTLCSTSVIKLTYLREGGYTAPVFVGIYKFDLLVDTGSSDLTVYSNLFGSDDAQHYPQKLYNCNSHTRYPGQTWGVDYIDQYGSSGVVTYGSVRLGGYSIPKQAIQCITTVTNPKILVRVPHGVLGFGFKEGNTVKPEKQNTVVGNFAEALGLMAGRKAVVKGKFTLDLYRQPPNGGTNPSNTIIGDCGCPSEGVEWVPVEPNSSGEYTFASESDKPAMVDSGSTFIHLLPEFVDQWYTGIDGSRKVGQRRGGHLWHIPCNANLNPLELRAGKSRIGVPPELLILNKLSSDNTHCWGAVQDMNPLMDFQVYGVPALQAIMACFDRDERQFGFCIKPAERKEATQADASAGQRTSKKGSSGKPAKGKSVAMAVKQAAGARKKGR